MRTPDHKQITNLTEIGLDSFSLERSSGPVSHRAYHELADTPVVELDALEQLESNLILLEGLQGRLAFAMREVREIMKL